MSEKRDGRKLNKWAAASFVALVVVASLGVGFLVAGKSTQNFGPIKTEINIGLSGVPKSELILPPFGKVSASTHKTPIILSLEVKEVDITKLVRWAEQPAKSEKLAKDLQKTITKGLVEAFAFGLLASCLVAFSIAYIMLKSRKLAIVSVLATLSVALALISTTAVSYDTKAFESAKFTGSFGRASEAIGILQGRLYNVENARKEIRQTAKTLASYYGTPQSLSGGDLKDTIRVLAVSDIHLDPIGFELETSLAKEFKVSAILDVGDINSYGTSLEADAMGKMFSPFRPYYFVAGNHDSPTIVDAVKAQKGVKVLEHSIAETAGISVYGIEDPSSKLYNMNPRDLDAENVGQGATSQFLDISSKEGTPSILAVHSPAMAKPFFGMAEVIVCGHTHTESITRQNGTWVIDVGTTGGIKSTDSKDYPHVPHAAAVLYFSKEKPHQLVAVDQISVSGLYDETSITRKLINPIVDGK